MIERIIKASSNKGDWMLYLFPGSGTTSKMALKLNRCFIGCENNIEYAKLNFKRNINYKQL